MKAIANEAVDDFVGVGSGVLLTFSNGIEDVSDGFKLYRFLDAIERRWKVLRTRPRYILREGRNLIQRLITWQIVNEYACDVTLASSWTKENLTLA